MRWRSVATSTRCLPAVMAAARCRALEAAAVAKLAELLTAEGKAPRYALRVATGPLRITPEADALSF